jgi:hypothetical protein
MAGFGLRTTAIVPRNAVKCPDARERFLDQIIDVVVAKRSQTAPQPTPKLRFVRQDVRGNPSISSRVIHASQHSEDLMTRNFRRPRGATRVIACYGAASNCIIFEKAGRLTIRAQYSFSTGVSLISLNMIMKLMPPPTMMSAAEKSCPRKYSFRDRC